MSLDAIQPGEVVILRRGHYNLPRPIKVSRVTSTQILIGDERFKKTNGDKVGESGGWHRTSIHLPKEGEIAQCYHDLRHALLVSRISTTAWKELPIETLESMYAILVTVDARFSPEQNKNK